MMILISPTPNLAGFGLFKFESKNAPGEVAQSDPTVQHHFSGVLHPHIHDPGIRNFIAGVSHQKCFFAQFRGVDPRLYIKILSEVYFKIRVRLFQQILLK